MTATRREFTGRSVTATLATNEPRVNCCRVGGATTPEPWKIILKRLRAIHFTALFSDMIDTLAAVQSQSPICTPGRRPEDCYGG